MSTLFQIKAIWVSVYTKGGGSRKSINNSYFDVLGLLAKIVFIVKGWGHTGKKVRNKAFLHRKYHLFYLKIYLACGGGAYPSCTFVHYEVPMSQTLSWDLFHNMFNHNPSHGICSTTCLITTPPMGFVPQHFWSQTLLCLITTPPMGFVPQHV